MHKDSFRGIKQAVQVIDLYNWQNGTRADFCQWQIDLLNSPSHPQQVYQSQCTVGVSDNNPVMLIVRPNFILALCGDKLFRANNLDHHELAV